MKKSLIALAVSSAAFTSISVMAENSTPELDIYGNIQYSLVNDDDGNEFEDNGSTFGFKGESEVSDDLTAFFKYELEADADEKDGDVNVALDQAFVGLKGGFGAVKLGTFDSIYGDAIQDAIDQFEYLGVELLETTTEGDTIAYYSPDLNGFEVQLSAQVKDDDTTDEDIALSAVVKYNLDALTFSAGYDSLENNADDTETLGFSVAYQAAPSLSLTANLETTSDVSDVIGLATRYGYGAGDLYAAAQVISPEAGDEYTEVAVGVTYDLTSDIFVYAEVGQLGSDEDTESAVGVYYGF